MKKIFILLMLLVLSCGYAYAGINDGLVAYYSFNGNANDESGNGHNGTVNSATLTTDVNGNPNSAFYFDGENDWINVTNNPDFNVSSFSIAAWVKYEAGDAIVGNYSGQELGKQHYGLRATSAYNVGPTFYYDDGYKANWLESSTSINNGEWHFIVGILNAGQDAKLYIDCNLSATDTNINKIPDTIQPSGVLCIGCDGSYSAERQLRGSVDEVRIYNRALSANEISQLYTYKLTIEYWKNLYEQTKAELDACLNPPTQIELSTLAAAPSDNKITLKWKTETETDNAGFNIWRAEGFQKINESFIPALGSPTAGSDYDFVDQWVLNGKRYFYLLEDIDTDGISTFHGPVKATPRWIYGAGK
jgi:hypothetical protein